MHKPQKRERKKEAAKKAAEAAVAAQKEEEAQTNLRVANLDMEFSRRLGRRREQKHESDQPTEVRRDK